MRISLKIHTLALWKFFVIIFLIILLVFVFNAKMNIILILAFGLLLLCIACFFIFRRKYLIFHKYVNVKNQIEKVLLLLSLENSKRRNSFYIKKYNMNIKILNLGIISMIYFNSKVNLKETKYIETVMLKYQYSL